MKFANLVARWKQSARGLQRETYALYYAYRDPRVPWYAKAFIALVVAYAFSPIDLIPDFIPILGYLDDLLLIPLGVGLALRMIPAEVMRESRARAEQALEREPRGFGWIALAATGGGVVVAGAVASLVARRFLQ
ncbi:MAG TPA: YkvA family protein [Anaerolinea sp.]|nr:YkvA family protein [Anaerolinea sp.]